MKNKDIIILLLLTACGVIAYKLYKCKHEENFSTGFSVTSGLSMYNRARTCSDGDVDEFGARSPYCESIGTLMF